MMITFDREYFGKDLNKSADALQPKAIEALKSIKNKSCKGSEFTGFAVNLMAAPLEIMMAPMSQLGSKMTILQSGSSSGGGTSSGGGAPAGP